MNDRTGDFLTVLETEHVVHRVSDTPEPELGRHLRGWHGDVFFDHVRGVIDANPAPLVERGPFLLVAHYRDYGWTAQHVTRVEELASAAALIAKAQALVATQAAAAAAAAAPTSTLELWEVYGVRVRERRPRPRRPRLVDGVDARLLEDIRNAPDDDGPRLVWADAVGGERGELVVIQIDLERGQLSPRDAIARRKRQRELLARHGAAWSGLAGIARRVSFSRGFVDAAEIPVPRFLARADDIMEAAPLLSALTATGLWADGPASDPVPLLSKLCADPAARELRGLDLATETTDELDGRLPGELALETLVASNMLRQLRALGSRDLVGMHGVRTLTNPRSLHQLERLWLGDVADADAMRMMLASPLPALRSLDLGARCPLGPLARFVPPTVTELIVGQLGRDGLTALANSAVAAALEVLYVQDTVEPASFAALPRLRALWLHAPLVLAQTPDAERGVRRDLATRDLPALRELACTGGIREHVARIVADELGPQLELLDLRGSPAALRFVNDLKRSVAGELRVGDIAGDERHQRHARRGLLRVGPTTQMPWWDHVTLE